MEKFTDEAFTKVMKNWSRLCKAQNRCVDCPLKRCIEPQKSIWNDDGDECYYHRMQEKIMKWAAEHPEPVYPTWGEWLLDMGAAKKIPVGIPAEMADGRMFDPHEIFVAVNERIPADIAQKLGIEPKEG